MSLRREGDSLVRDPFDPAAPGDYAAPPDAARAVLDTLVGTKDKLFDPRYRGPLDGYRVFVRREEADQTFVLLCGNTQEHCLELTVRVKAVGDYPGAASNVEEIMATLSRPNAQNDPQDRGGLENYVLVARRDEGDFTVLVVRNTNKGKDVEVWLRVVAAPPERAYQYLLDQDEVWRKAGRVIYDERNPRPR